jgi:hypothetical protein
MCILLHYEGQDIVRIGNVETEELSKGAEMEIFNLNLQNSIMST